MSVTIVSSSSDRPHEPTRHDDPCMFHLISAEKSGEATLPCEIIDPLPLPLLEGEICNLQQEGCLLESQGSFDVYLAHADSIPYLLKEIGRLREVSFRMVGEGTGKAFDLDTYDSKYLHLFLWHRDDRAIAGGYRLGRTDVLLRNGDHTALYTASLFDFDPEFWDEINPALEMGRSFVSPQYQRSIHPLSLLWRGIGKFVSQNPKYSKLFGPVSISDLYSKPSQELMVGYLTQHHAEEQLSPMVQPRNPFQLDVSCGQGESPATMEQLAAMVAELEHDRKGVPILIRQYIKLHARMLSCNVDSNFNNALDLLVLVDLTKSPIEALSRHMGKQAAAEFMAFHHG